MDNSESKKCISNIICFDGVCNLCNGFVNFIIAIDRNCVFKFCSLQSETGQAVLEELNFKNELSTIVYVESLPKRVYYTKSEAILQIAKGLGFPYNSLYWIGHLLIPFRPIRDLIYDYLSSNRYYLFGRQDACKKPSKNVQNRFLL